MPDPQPAASLIPSAPLPLSDDLVAAFQIAERPVRGRVVRLGAAVDEVLTRHDYPDAVAGLLGEACALAALVGSALKFDGKLIVQAQGDGPVRYVVADYDTSGGLRGYCRYDADELAAATAGGVRPGAKTLLGEGLFIMTVDQGAVGDRYQGVTAIEGASLSLCAEQYFAQSEQVPTRVRLAVGQADDGSGPRWRAGGLLIQHIAADDARGSTSEAWETAQAHVVTVADDELIDPTLSAQRLLLRLFHEDGVRLEDARPMRAFCRCSEERIVGMLRSFGEDERAEMVEANGKIGVTCEYCSRRYEIDPNTV